MIASTETRATLILGTLIRAYPDQIRAALSDAGVPVPGPIERDEVVVEKEWGEKGEKGEKKKRVDVAFFAGQQFVVEAKVDAGPELDQVLGYMSWKPNTVGVLLVPELAFSEAKRSVDGHSDIHILTWDQLLNPLAEITPIANDLLDDITTLQGYGSTKTKQRAAMRKADSHVKVAATTLVTAGSGNWPSINVKVDGTWVFGQVQGPKDVKKEVPTYQLSIGFRVDSNDYNDPSSNARMGAALRRLGERLDDEKIEINRGMSANDPSKWLGLEDTPYLTRGYKDSYIGVKMPSRGSADDALFDAARTVPILTEVYMEIWPANLENEAIIAVGD